MYKTHDGRILKTKIVATMGPDTNRTGLFDRNGKPLRRFRSPEEFRDAFMNLFFEKDCFLIDILRVNMAFYRRDKENIRRIFNWLKENAPRAADIAVLGDLPGPKVRLGGVWEPRSMKLDEPLEICIARPTDETRPHLLVGDTPLAECDPQAASRISRLLKHEPLTAAVGDGELELRLTELTDHGLLKCQVAKKGRFNPGKGFTLKGVSFEFPSFGPLDSEALDFLLDEGIDWSQGLKSAIGPQSFLAYVGLSFVKTKNDIINLRWELEKRIARRLRETTPGLSPEQAARETRLLCPGIIAKIETMQAVDPGDNEENLNGILDYADGLMIARGDLAHQIGPQNVPAIQKRLIKLCNLRGKPVITATQMLRSMEQNPEPTRAEATDVFNAILDGTDAVMLSEETAAGVYPYQSVRTMITIAEAAESYSRNMGRVDEPRLEERRRARENRAQEILIGSERLAEKTTQRLSRDRNAAEIADNLWLADWLRQELKKSLNQPIIDRISMTAGILSNNLDEKDGAIIAATMTGHTARMIAKFRPAVKIIASAGDEINRRKLILSRGVCTINRGRISDKTGLPFQTTDEILEQSYSEAEELGLIRDGQTFIYVAGTPLDEPGNTNFVQVKKFSVQNNNPRTGRAARPATTSPTPQKKRITPARTGKRPPRPRSLQKKRRTAR